VFAKPFVKNQEQIEVYRVLEAVEKKAEHSKFLCYVLFLGQAHYEDQKRAEMREY